MALEKGCLHSPFLSRCLICWPWVLDTASHDIIQSANDCTWSLLPEGREEHSPQSESFNPTCLQSSLASSLSDFAGTPIQPQQDSSHAGNTQVPYLSLINFFLLIVAGQTVCPKRHLVGSKCSRHDISAFKAYRECEISSCWITGALSSGCCVGAVSAAAVTPVGATVSLFSCEGSPAGSECVISPSPPFFSGCSASLASVASLHAPGAELGLSPTRMSVWTDAPRIAI